ncbi:MAG: histidine kinase dimerization/phosphoacceptor domain -containing protein [Spirochaetota bacterium]
MDRDGHSSHQDDVLPEFYGPGTWVRLVQALDVGVCTLDGENCVVSANPAVTQLCGLQQEELKRTKFTALWDQPVPIEVIQALGEDQGAPGVAATARGGSLQAEVDLRRRDGRAVPLRLALSPLTDDESRRIGTVVVLTDLSEHRRREAALRDEVRRLGLLLKETHHRVKNNLQIIASLVAILAGSEDDPPSWVESLEQRVRAIAMVHETIYTSSTYGDVNLHDYIRRMVDNSLAQAGLSGSVHVSIDIASGRLSLAETIPVGIILSEFLTNSIKYAFTGRSKGRLTIRETEGPDEVVELYYADDGPGLSPEKRESPRPGSVGMEIVEALTAQLGGELVFGGAPGFSATLTFPRNRSPKG